MADKRAYSYVVLRYRHDPLAGEFANVGVLLHSPAHQFVGARLRHTAGRLTKMFPGLMAEEFKQSLRSMRIAAEKIAKNEGGDLLATVKDAQAFSRQILPDDDSSYFWSSMGSGLTSDPKATLEELYRRFVAQYDIAQRGGRDDEAVWRPVKEKLIERDIANRLAPTVITSSIESVEFDYAWKNGAWHCYQPISFDLASDDSIKEKAHRWAGTLVGLEDVAQTFKPFFLVGAPSKPGLQGAYAAALKLLEKSPGHPVIIQERDADQLVDRIEDEIRAHDRATN